MRHHRKVVLPPDHHTQLERIIHAGKVTASVHARARILLLTDYGQGQHLTDVDIAASLRVSQSTVVRVRKRYLNEGLEAILQDKPRPGQPPNITGAVEAHLTVLAYSAPPDGHDHWTLRLLADRLVELGHVDRISHTAIGKRLKKIHASPG
ncbi:MAG TPA: helix-turn-helix domain-containing protein [Armatimonadota bacterium]|jgi:transposase